MLGAFDSELKFWVQRMRTGWVEGQDGRLGEEGKWRVWTEEEECQWPVLNDASSRN